MRLEGVQFRAFRSADPSASGTASQATYRRNSGEVEAATVRVTLPGNGAPDLTLAAPVLVGDLAARSWSARGSVVLERGDVTARTATARYSGADGVVRGDEPVEVVGPGYRLAGPSFTADPATGDAEIRGGVRLAASPPSPPVTVDADEVQYLYKERKVVFTGKPFVKLTREDAVLTCRKLVAENDDQGRIRQAVCSGDVKLTRGTRVVTCETATFEEKTARVTCAGDPVLRDGENVMRGDALVYDLAADKATLSGAKGVIVPPPGAELSPGKKKEPAR